MEGSWRNAIAFYYCANRLHELGIPVLPRLIQILLFLVCGAVVPYRAQIGPRCSLAHGGNGVVISPHVRIGSGVLICQQVTIGVKSIGQSVPVIGDNVYIGPGAKVLGPVEVGDDSVIGANAVVVDSVPARSVVAGVPARVIRSEVTARSKLYW